MATIPIEDRFPAGPNRRIYLRITHQGIRRYVSLGLTIHEQHWDTGQAKVRDTHPEHTAINEQIDRERQRGQTATQEVTAGDSSVTADRIKTQYLTLREEQPSDDAGARS